MSQQKRIIYGLGVILCVILGLGSRKFGIYLPSFIAEYAGDILWAAMVYLGIRVLSPSLSLWKSALYALLFSYGIEISQLYQADWINAIRNNPFGALVLGHGFLWSDMVCYTVGIVCVACIDRLLTKSER